MPVARRDTPYQRKVDAYDKYNLDSCMFIYMDVYCKVWKNINVRIEIQSHVTIVASRIVK